MTSRSLASLRHDSQKPGPASNAGRARATCLALPHPRLSFHVHATDTATACQALLARKVDLAVVHIIEPRAEDLMHVELLVQDPHRYSGGCAQSHCASARAWPGGIDGGALGVTSPRSTVRHRRLRGVSCPWAKGPTSYRRLDTASPHGATDDRPFPVHGATGRDAFSAEAPAAQGLADRFAIDSETTGDRDLEEQNTQSARPTVCRAYPRSGAAARPSMAPGSGKDGPPFGCWQNCRF